MAYPGQADAYPDDPRVRRHARWGSPRLLESVAPARPAVLLSATSESLLGVPRLRPANDRPADVGQELLCFGRTRARVDPHRERGRTEWNRPRSRVAVPTSHG
jgi:hypothetical protein